MEQKNRIEGKNSSLNDSRLERLQMIGFRWAKRKGQASWNEKFVSYTYVMFLRALFGGTQIAHICINRYYVCDRMNSSSTRQGMAIATSPLNTRLTQPSDVGCPLNVQSTRSTQKGSPRLQWPKRRSEDSRVLVLLGLWPFNSASDCLWCLKLFYVYLSYKCAMKKLDIYIIYTFHHLCVSWNED